ncbi:MAG: 4-hydroxy-tetrahydrodipicolinate synthase [Peptococcaceae bacterium]
MEKWGRLVTAMATPFDIERKVNYHGARQLAQKLEKEGSSALVIAGTTGESPTLTVPEKLELLKCVKKAVNIPIIANVGSNNTEASVDLTLKVKELGIDGVMVVVPYYNKPNKKGILAHFKAIAEAAQLPVLAYNVPGRTGTNLDLETLLALTEIPNIVALKEATNEFEKISLLIKETPANFSIYTGEDALTLPVMSIGGYGVISVAAHLVGREMKKMIECYLQGQVAEAQKIHLNLSPIYKNLFLTANPIPLKAALKIIGFDAGPLRLPLVEAEEFIIEKLKKSLRDLSLLEEAN